MIGAVASTAAQHFKTALYIAGLGKDKNSEFEVLLILNAYYFFTIIRF